MHIPHPHIPHPHLHLPFGHKDKPPASPEDGKGNYAPVSTVVDDDPVEQTPSVATTVHLEANVTFLEGMKQNESLDDSLAYLEAWGSKDYTTEIKRNIVDPDTALTVFSWICQRVKQARRKSYWAAVWKKLCDQIVVAYSASSGKDIKQDFVLLVEGIMTYEYMGMARMMPNTLGFPLREGLQATASKLGIDVLSQFLVLPSEGLFLLWHSILWEYRGTFQRKLRFPSQDMMLNELTKFRAQVTPSRVVSMAGTERRQAQTNVAARKEQTTEETFGDDCGGARTLMVHSTTQSNLESMLLDGKANGEEDADDGEEHLYTCKSTLEAVCAAFSMMKPKRANLKRLRRILGMVMGSEDQGLIRVITTSHYFMAFYHEEEPIVFFLYVLLRLDEQQMLGHYDELQDQMQRVIRFHSNSLFTALRLAATVLKLRKRGGIMADTWRGEHKTLKKVAVQIFEMLPQASFNSIFDSNQAQQSFTTLVVREAECLAMLDSPRFQDYLHARWNGLLKAPDEIHDIDDYAKYWETLVDPNTLIYSPKIRFFFNAVSFVFLTIYLHTLPEEILTQCVLGDVWEWDYTYIVLWSCCAGRIIAEIVDLVHTGFGYLFDIWNIADSLLVSLYCTFYLNCIGKIELLPETVKLLWGISVSVMALRWLQFLTPFEKFSGLVKTIGLMTLDVSYFLLIFTIFLMSWAMLFTRLRPEDPNYSTSRLSLFTFFRASLGDFDLQTLLNESDLRMYGWIETSAFIVFLLVAAVLLLNLLISIMATTYNTVQAKGAAESAKTFLETIAEGENHDLLELGALPPPLNVVYLCLIPPFLLVALPIVFIMERCDCQKGWKRYKRVSCQMVAPILFRLILFPLTLTLLAVVSLPSFALMVILSPTIPWEPRCLNVNYDFHSAWCAVRCHLLMPTARLRRIYRRTVGARVASKAKGVRFALYPFCAVGCSVVAVIMFCLIMPADWLYETLIRGLSTSSESHQQHLQKSKEGPAHEDVKKAAAARELGDPRIQYWLQGQVQSKGLLEIDSSSAEAQLLLGDEDTEKAEKESYSNFDLSPDTRSWIRLSFMPDSRTLDIGMLLCYGRLKKAPDLLASQLSTVFENAIGHEGRVEDMLDKIHTKLTQSAFSSILKTK